MNNSTIEYTDLLAQHPLLMELDEREMEFCFRIARNEKKGEAAQGAGYSTDNLAAASATASRKLKKDAIFNAIDYIRAMGANNINDLLAMAETALKAEEEANYEEEHKERLNNAALSIVKRTRQGAELKLLSNHHVISFLEQRMAVNGTNFWVPDDTLGGLVKYRIKEEHELTQAERSCVAKMIVDDNGDLKDYVLVNFGQRDDLIAKVKNLHTGEGSSGEEKSRFMGVNIDFGTPPVDKERWAMFLEWEKNNPVSQSAIPAVSVEIPDIGDKDTQSDTSSAPTGNNASGAPFVGKKRREPFVAKQAPYEF